MGNQNQMNKQECMEKYDFILNVMQQMQQDNSYLKQAFDTLEKIPVSDTPGDISGQARAMAIGDAVKAKEQTNQQLLNVYNRMYSDLRTVLFDTELIDKDTDEGEEAEGIEETEKTEEPEEEPMDADTFLENFISSGANEGELSDDEPEPGSESL